MSAFWNIGKKKESEKQDPAIKAVVSRTKSDKDEEQKRTKKQDKEGGAKKTTKSKKSKQEVIKNKEKATLVEAVILRPIISENSMTKEALGKYVFEVDVLAGKRKIAEAVEAKYGVKVIAVNTLIRKAKKRNFRGRVGFEKKVKKAVVTVKAGDKIELFSS